MKDQIAVEETTKPSEDPITVRYLINSFGAPLGQDSKVGEAASKRSYFVPDLRGNLSQLLGPENDNDEVKGVFAYDPYGKEKKTEDDDSLSRKLQGWDSRLGYQMAPQDKLTGNYNLGPRLLNPNINRFVGADFYAAGAANMALQVDPLTGNRYLYAGANPAGLIDNGHRTCQSARSSNILSSSWHFSTALSGPSGAEGCLTPETIELLGDISQIGPRDNGAINVTTTSPKMPQCCTTVVVGPQPQCCVTTEDQGSRPRIDAANPKPPANFIPPSNPPQYLPPAATLPAGQQLRVGPKTPEYPYGYWRQFDPEAKAMLILLQENTRNFLGAGG